MGYPQIADTPEPEMLYSDTSIQKYEAGIEKIRDELKTRFPGVFSHVGSISDGSGFGFTTVIIQGELVAEASKIFPGALISAMSAEDYEITRGQSTGALHAA